MYSLRDGQATKVDWMQSDALWKAFIDGLRSLGPPHSDSAASLDRVTFIHASSFAYDGATLRLFSALTTGSPPSTPLTQLPYPPR